MAHTAPPPPAPITVWREDHASPWQRLGAAALDVLFVSIVFFPLLLLAIDWETTRTSSEASFRMDVTWWSYLVFPVVGFVYQVPTVALWGRTPGKFILRIAVVSARDLGRPGWWRAIRRWGIFVLVGFIPIIGAFVALALPLPLIWNLNRQGVHDILADTLVMKNHAVPWVG